MSNIIILTGSTRPGRFNIQPATWLAELTKQRKDANFSLVDVADLNLPFLDEAAPAMMHQYSQEHTKKWAKIVEEADGFVFVTPEYNHSYSAVLKNAIDYLNIEWNYKPVTFVSYGSLAGGSRAVEHLRTIAAEVRMYDLREQLMLPNYWENLDATGKFQFNDRHAKTASEMLDALVFWADTMKTARKKMAGKK